MSRIRRIAPGLGRGGLLGNTEGPESYLRELDTLPSQFCRATGGTETVISQGGKYYRVHTFTDTDPTSLLLNFDGANGSTTFTDDSGWGHTVTANGNAAISTTQSKFGGSSLALDGTGDYLTGPNNSLIHVLDDDFTLELWFRLSAAQGIYGLLSTYQAITTSEYGYILRLDSTFIRFYYGKGASGSVAVDRTFSFSEDQWYHVAVTNSGGTGRLFIDGVQQGATFSISGVANSALALQVGRTHGQTDDFPGYIDSLRITKGQALYTAAFTPPTTALTRVGSGSLTFTRGGAVEYLVVGGGGAGGGVVTGSSLLGTGGGGAGGFRTGTGLHVTAGNGYTVAVGGGGTGSSNTNTAANGSDSALGSITATGGGGSATTPNSGGSGAGARGTESTGITGASGTSGEGNKGGDSQTGSGGNNATAGAGGGGAGAAGSNGGGVNGNGGAGGNGLASAISGSSVTYAGGGGGGSSGTGTPANGGTGGGGNAVKRPSTTGGAGAANTGGGGGGVGNSTASAYTGTGGDGGSGIVIARYRITQAEYEAEAA